MICARLKTTHVELMRTMMIIFLEICRSAASAVSNCKV